MNDTNPLLDFDTFNPEVERFAIFGRLARLEMEMREEDRGIVRDSRDPAHRHELFAQDEI